MAPAAAALLLASCLGAGSGGSGGTSTPQPAWHPCGGGFRCSTLRVPVDYSRPQGPPLGLALIEHRARSPRRAGTLIVSSGGIGGAGTAWLRRNLPLLRDLGSRFDLVAYDARGSAGSAALRCLPSRSLDRYLALDPVPHTRSQVTALARAARHYARGCRRDAPGLVPNLGAATQALDLDRVRAALGERRITFLGLSAGATVGAAYVRSFPARVRAAALDAPVPPGVPARAYVAGRAEGLERSLERFLGTCHRDCPLTPREDTPRGVRRFLARLGKHPVPAGSRTLTAAEAYLGLQVYLDDPRGWPLLDDALHRAMHGDGRMLLRGFDVFTERKASGRYPSDYDDYIASACEDHRWPGRVAAYRSWARRLERRAPVFGSAMVWEHLPCRYWPIPAPAPNGNAASARPVLLVAATGDPFVPRAWVTRLHRDLPGSALLVRLGYGHTSYFQSACVRDEVDAYLVDLRLPEARTRCPSDYGPGSTG